MNKEFRVSIRLIALWLVFIISLYFIFTSVSSLTVATFRAVNGGYEMSYNPMNVGYAPYCIQPPVYPQMNSGYGAPTDQAAWEKYNQEYEAYNQQIAQKCKEDIAKQEMMQYNQSMANAMSDIASSIIATMFAIVVAVMAGIAIRRGENA